MKMKFDSIKIAGLILSSLILIGGAILLFWAFKPAPTETTVTPVTETVKSFPFIFWFIIVGLILAARVAVEISGIYDDKNKDKPWYRLLVTLNMAAIGAGLLSFLVFFLEGFGPDNWWENVLKQKPGVWALWAFSMWMVLTFILPGTGASTTKWTERLMPAALMGIVITITSVAFNPQVESPFSEKKFAAPSPAYAAPEPRTLMPPPLPPPPPKWEKTIYYSPTKPGWQEFEIPEEIESFKVEVTGSHQQQFLGDDRKPVFWTIRPGGAKRMDGSPAISPVQHLFPDPSLPPAHLIMKVGDEIVPLQNNARYDLSSLGGKLTISINLPLDDPKNFTGNEGGYYIKVKEI